MPSAHALSRRLRFAHASRSAARGMLAAVALTAGLGVARQATAQQPDPAPTPTPAKIDVSAFVDVYYGYNFNKIGSAACAPSTCSTTHSR